MIACNRRRRLEAKLINYIPVYMMLRDGSLQTKGLLSFLHILVLLALLSISRAEAPTTTMVGTDPLPSTAAIGVAFNISVTIEEVLNLCAWEFNMTFDTTVLDAVAVYEGPFLTDTGYGTWWLDPTMDNTRGIVTGGCHIFPYPDYGADGSGVLAYVTILVEAKGKSNLHFADTQLRWWDTTGLKLEIIDHTAKDGFFQLPLGDINNDGIVSANDLRILGKAYGSTSGQPSYNPNADLNKDDTVDRDDLVIVSSNYGKN